MRNLHFWIAMFCSLASVYEILSHHTDLAIYCALFVIINLQLGKYWDD